MFSALADILITSITTFWFLQNKTTDFNRYLAEANQIVVVLDEYAETGVADLEDTSLLN